MNIVYPGVNYGWNVMEGSECFRAASCNRDNLQAPVAEYDHSLGCSITGGYVYRGQRVRELEGVYLYADFCSGRIWGLRHDGAAVTAQAELVKAPFQISSFGEDAEGEVYVVGFDGGIYTFAAAPGEEPQMPRRHACQRPLVLQPSPPRLHSLPRPQGGQPVANACVNTRAHTRGEAHEHDHLKAGANANFGSSRAGIVHVQYRLVVGRDSGRGGWNCGWACLPGPALWKRRPAGLDGGYRKLSARRPVLMVRRELKWSSRLCKWPLKLTPRVSPPPVSSATLVRGCLRGDLGAEFAVGRCENTVAYKG